MYRLEDIKNKIICGDALTELRKFPNESINTVICSPPYWGLRDYKIKPQIWDSDEDCQHEWGNNFCSKCGAWRGVLGLEPTFDLYIKHLCDIFGEVKRVLRKDGCLFVNIGDTYNGSGQDSGKQNRDTSQELGNRPVGIAPTKQSYTRGYPKKSLCDIPFRFSIEMINRGWVKRNTIIWWKRNCMPSSVGDRFTVDFDYVFFFTKNNKTIYWVNEKTSQLVDKKPPGIKGIEGLDWEWRNCPRCASLGYFNYRVMDARKKEGNCPQFTISQVEKECLKKKICFRCKGLGKIKYSFWSGRDYWFEQQFEEYKTESIERLNRGISEVNKWIAGPNGQTKHRLNQPRTNRKTKIPAEFAESFGSPRARYHRMPPIGGIKQTEGSGNPTYSGNQPLWTQLGRNPRCVWDIPTKGFPGAHFAVFPEELVIPMVKASCPEFICKICGKGREKVYQSNKFIQTDCGCDHSDGWDSGIVLDPFCGSGTTCLVAKFLGRHFIGIDVSEKYVRMTENRLKEEIPLLIYEPDKQLTL